MKCLRIGNGCGFWGDNIDAPVLLAKHGQLDYLTLEYLAELTMSILALQKQRDPQAGYATDFLDVLPRLGWFLYNQPKLKIITNAGGMNPAVCAARAREILDQGGLADRVVAAVSGDDLMDRLDGLLEQGHGLSNLDRGEPLTAVRPHLVSANAYLGAVPIVDALRQGADIVITGRVADASLTLAPAIHEFGWAWDDWDRLAAGTVAGHLIECGAQVTGGLWCNWPEAPDLGHVGYPIAEIDADGTFRITKPDGSGGRVNVETVSEQLLYEVGDPAAYLTPDVTADFTSVTLTQTGPDVVEVRNARGKPATDSYKVSIAYRDGFTASGTLVIFGPQAAAKARHCAEMIRQRMQVGLAHRPHTGRGSITQDPRVACKFSNIELLGTGACVPGVVPAGDPPEVVLRVTVRDPWRWAVERFTKEFAPLVTSGPPGVTGYTTGRPPVREVFAYWPTLIAKSAVTPEVRLLRGAKRS